MVALCIPSAYQNLGQQVRCNLSAPIDTRSAHTHAHAHHTRHDAARLTCSCCRLRIENTITYLTPSFLATTEPERRKCALLRSYDVLVHQVHVPPNDWHAFYDQALEHLRASRPTPT